MLCCVSSDASCALPAVKTINPFARIGVLYPFQGSESLLWNTKVRRLTEDLCETPVMGEWPRTMWSRGLRLSKVLRTWQPSGVIGWRKDRQCRILLLVRWIERPTCGNEQHGLLDP